MLTKNSKAKIQMELLKLNLKFGGKRAIKGIDYWRYFEYPLTSTFLDLKKNDVVGDIGSLDTIFPIYLANKCAKVFAIDISKRVKEVENQARKKGVNNFVGEIADATKLPYSDNFFDKMSVVSSIEHILPLEDGDTMAAKEIQRVLKSGGIVVMTVPYNRKFKEEWREGNERFPTHLMRSYDKKNLESRLIKPFEKSLDSLKILYLCDDSDFWKIWYRRLVYFLNPISFVFSNLFIKVRSEPINAKGAVIVIRKK